jgi:hypothetical protein
MTPTDRFLDAFGKIEQHLRNMLQPEGFEPFMSMVNRAAERDTHFLRMRPTLKELARIRNFLTHNNRPLDPVAELTERPAKEIEKALELLLAPPRLIPRFASEVAISATDEKLSLALTRMGMRSVTKLPVYRGVKLVGLLAAKTITRWLGQCSPTSIPSLSQITVQDVLKYQDGESLHTIMRGDATYFDALHAFEDAAYHQGRHLDAILLTANGTDEEPLQGMVTVSQVPELSRAIAVFNC